ncbi:MAG: hypothetical protein J1F17_01660 [Oscillospiraceae bacterium]|nr:hypothetical protein [Oscillospiraceae bacterium]
MAGLTLEEAKRELEKAYERQSIHEVGNDMYYSSNQYKEDKQDIQFWKDYIKAKEAENA